MTETRTAHISVIEEGLLKFEMKPDLIFNINDCKSNHEEIKKLRNNSKYKLLVVTNTGITLTEDAREESASPDIKKDLIAEAIVSEFLPSFVLTFFYTRFHKPKHPVRVFRYEDKALKWLKSR